MLAFFIYVIHILRKRNAENRRILSKGCSKCQWLKEHPLCYNKQEETMFMSEGTI